uniref:Uncharacterized protein n=1 Tax=Globodera rostochiensis TaxID=31243 RepID=A0A914HEQ3_GLORO
MKKEEDEERWRGRIKEELEKDGKSWRRTRKGCPERKLNAQKDDVEHADEEKEEQNAEEDDDEPGAGAADELNNCNSSFARARTRRRGKKKKQQQQNHRRHRAVRPSYAIHKNWWIYGKVSRTALVQMPVEQPLPEIVKAELLQLLYPECNQNAWGGHNSLTTSYFPCPKGWTALLHLFARMEGWKRRKKGHRKKDESVEGMERRKKMGEEEEWKGWNEGRMEELDGRGEEEEKVGRWTNGRMDGRVSGFELLRCNCAQIRGSHDTKAGLADDGEKDRGRKREEGENGIRLKAFTN